MSDRLRPYAGDVDVVRVPSVDLFEGGFGRSLELKRRIAAFVVQVVVRNAIPLVLVGDCNTTVGVHAGVVWFDAHLDFDAPDKRSSGCFDGMGVAMLAGQC